MVPLDYGRSFLIGKASSNEVRLWIESRTRIIDDRDGYAEDYVQAASCKSEHTFAKKDLLHEDNYDFLPVFGPVWGIIYRRKACSHSEYKSIVPSAEMWEGQKYSLVEGEQVEELNSDAAVRQATYSFSPIVAQTEIKNADTGLRAVIEYPVKTMNTHRGDDIFQVDTGPVLLPDLSVRGERYVDALDLAFVVFNAPHFADFVLEVPTAVGTEEVHHYSRLLTLETQNRLYAVRN